MNRAGPLPIVVGKGPALFSPSDRMGIMGSWVSWYSLPDGSKAGSSG